MSSSERLFTPHFFVMCGYSFTVFLSAFLLFPTAPFHIRDLGGSTFAAGLFLGLLTYSSAFSAPFTGSLGDRIGHKKMLIVCSLAIAGFTVAYALVGSWWVTLALVVPHGVFWSGLLSASGAYMMSLLPEKRRGEGISYWGISSIIAIAVAPLAGFWIYRFGWIWVCGLIFALNLIMTAIATTLKEMKHPPQEPAVPTSGGLLEWGVFWLALTMFLYAFSYGGITSFSALYAESYGIVPKGIYLTTLATVMLVSRPFSAPLGDRFGYRRVFVPCLMLATIGLSILPFGPTRGSMMASAMIFGLGFGSAFPVFTAYIMQRVNPRRRGAAYGAIIAAFDTGIGTGSTSMGWIIQRHGYRAAFAVAAAVSALAVPYFLMADRRWRRR
ncbi:MAG: MFS transporter [Vicinamibacterales bacterium]